MDKTDRLRDYGLAFLLYEHGLGVCGYELIRELFIFIKLILNSYLVIGVEQAATEIDSSLDELPDKELTDDIHFESKGFMEPVHVTEFPIRNQLDMKSTGIMTKRKLVNQ